MSAIVWPCDVLAPRTIAIDLANRTMSGPASVSGFSQVVASDAGLWKATFDAIPVYDEYTGLDRIKLWRALAAMAEGRLAPILICASGRRETGDEIFGQSVPHSDNSYFSDGTGYLSTYTNVVTSASAAVRATTLTLIKVVAVDLEIGQRFSIGERLYQIKGITDQDDDSATVRISPPLREFVEAGAQLEFDRPVLRVRLASDQEMDLPLEFGRWSFPSVSFLEDL